MSGGGNNNDDGYDEHTGDRDLRQKGSSRAKEIS